MLFTITYIHNLDITELKWIYVIYVIFYNIYFRSETCPRCGTHGKKSDIRKVQFIFPDRGNDEEREDEIFKLKHTLLQEKETYQSCNEDIRQIKAEIADLTADIGKVKTTRNAEEIVSCVLDDLIGFMEEKFCTNNTHGKDAEEENVLEELIEYVYKIYISKKKTFLCILPWKI